MNDKGKGFMLTPSRLGKPAVEVAKPVFTGRNQFSQVVAIFSRKKPVFTGSNQFHR